MNSAPAILIVEDRSIVAAKVRSDLERAGFKVAGLAGTLAGARRLAETALFDGAVLDIDLGGELAYPIAATLRRRAIPFLFVTGYGQLALPVEWQTNPLLEKPFSSVQLVRALRLALSGERPELPRVRVVTPAIRRAWDEMRHSRDLVTEQRAWAEQGWIIVPS